MLYHMPNLEFILSMFPRFFGSRITLSIWLLATILAITPTSQLQIENESPKPSLLIIGVPFEVHSMHTNLQTVKALGQWNQFTNNLNLNPNCEKFKKFKFESFFQNNIPSQLECPLLWKFKNPLLIKKDNSMVCSFQLTPILFRISTTIEPCPHLH